VIEQRRKSGSRGGIAIIIKNGIKITRDTGNEYA
jgi:hypothetical protein